MSDVTTIPAAVLAEAHKVYCGGRFAGFEEALAVIARHWPAATPDRYAAGFRDGVEKAAANVDEIAASHEHDAAQAAKTEYPEDGHAARDMAHAHRKAATAIRALAPPDAEPVATPDRYAAGFRDGVEKAAAAFHSTTALLSRGEIITAIRALAPPDDDLLVGRLRWEKWPGGEAAYLGKIPVGWVLAASEGRWVHRTRLRTGSHYADTLEAARAALVEAVRREVQGGGDE